MGRALPGVADVCTAICCDGPEEMPALHLEVKESTNECFEALDYRAPGFKVTICLYASWVHAGVHHEERTNAIYETAHGNGAARPFNCPYRDCKNGPFKIKRVLNQHLKRKHGH